VIVLRDVIGERGALSLGTGEAVERQRVATVVFSARRRHRTLDARADQRPVVLGGAFERLPGQVEAVELGIAVFEAGQDAQGLIVVREAAIGRHLGVQCDLALMAERRVAEIVRQRQGLRQILVEAEGARDCAGDLRDFKRVCQARAVMIPLRRDKDLSLVHKAAKRSRMDNAIAVALKRGPGRIDGFRVEPATTLVRSRRIWLEISSHGANRSASADVGILKRYRSAIAYQNYRSAAAPCAAAFIRRWSSTTSATSSRTSPTRWDRENCTPKRRRLHAGQISSKFKSHSIALYPIKAEGIAVHVIG